LPVVIEELLFLTRIVTSPWPVDAGGEVGGEIVRLVPVMAVPVTVPRLEILPLASI